MFIFKFTLILVGAIFGGFCVELNRDVKYTVTPANFGPIVKNVVEMNPSAFPKPSSLQFDPVIFTKQFMERESHLTPFTVRVSSSHKSHNGITHVYLQQVVNGLDVHNGVANVNLDSYGIVSAASSFFKKSAPAPTRRVEKEASEAVMSFAKLLVIAQNRSNLRTEYSKGSTTNACTVNGASFAVRPISAQLKYVQADQQGRLVPVWNLRVRTKGNMYNAHVDTTSGEVLSLVDWISHATYKVYPLGVNDPDTGVRVNLREPANLKASPLGWQSQGTGHIFTETISNNVFAQTNPDGGDDFLQNSRPNAGPVLNFNFPLDLSRAPSKYANAATTNLFYWNNLMHDIYYMYGFTEVAGNFQQNNLGRGGLGGDSVVAFAQDGSGINNSNFETPPDGEPGVMRHFIWNFTNPNRDSDLDNGLIVHEYTHGLSNRLTGGAANTDCLGTGEGLGLGEGWSDFTATILRTTARSTRRDTFAMGAYVVNKTQGFRHFVYSTNLKINPTTYAFIQRSTQQHDEGEIWCSMLYEIYWNLVEHWGYEPNWSNVNPVSLSNRGNVMMLQLVVDGMKLQPCNPTFIEARDAILLADRINNKGANQCRIWNGFAKRGLGIKAAVGRREDFGVPIFCKING